jgi:Ca2+-binding EF-hand superfamily protein
MFFDRATRQLNITNGQITREQFKDGFNQMQNRMQNGGGMPGGGGPPNADMQDRFAEQRFRSYDKNNDGLLSPDEMPEALRNERDKWDTDKNGFIDLNEFKAYFKSRFEQRNDRGDVVVGGPEQPNVATLPAQEQDFDLRRPVVYRAGHLPKELPDWFKQLDIDNDGQVGLYEWVKGGKAISEFREMDFNDDGFLTAEEVLRFVRGGKSPLVNMASNGDSIGSMMLNSMSPSFNSRNGGNNGQAGTNNGGNNNWNRFMGNMGGDRTKGGGGGDRPKGGDRSKGGDRPKGGDRSKDARGGN